LVAQFSVAVFNGCRLPHYPLPVLPKRLPKFPLLFLTGCPIFRCPFFRCHFYRESLIFLLSFFIYEIFSFVVYLFTLQECVFVTLSGQRPQFMAPQPQVRQVEPMLLAAPPQTTVIIRNAPSSFAQPPPQPLPQVPSVPQPAPQVITVPAPAVSFPSHPVPQSQMYTGVPANHGIPQQQTSLFPGQPNCPNFVGQQPGVNVVRPMGGANVQPVYRNVEPFGYPQPPNQTTVVQHQPGPVHHQPPQPVFPQIPPPAGDRLSFDGNVIRTPMSSQSGFPGYVEFGVGEPNPVRFKTDFSSDPEIVGQPIETVIHNRKGPAHPVDGRALSGFGQNKTRPFFGVK